MSTEWQGTFRARMRHFNERRPPKPGETAVSIKVRVLSGCFHRQHSPRAYALIDQGLLHLSRSEFGFAFEEHESGPELLVYVALGTAGVTFAKSVIDLVTAIIKARPEGVSGGDGPSDPVELVVRRTSENGEFREEVVLRLGSRDSVSDERIEKCLRQALESLIGTGTDKQGPLLPPPQGEGDRKRSRRRSH